jgi:predicted ATPase with chaperone activity
MNRGLIRLSLVSGCLIATSLSAQAWQLPNPEEVAWITVEPQIEITETYYTAECLLAPLLQNAIRRLHFSARAVYRILRVAHTTADLNHRNVIENDHIAEALNYRQLDRATA